MDVTSAYRWECMDCGEFAVMGGTKAARDAHAEAKQHAYDECHETIVLKITRRYEMP